MKNRMNYSAFFSLIVPLFLLLSLKTTAQEKVNISAGFGFAEMLNLGIRFQHKQSQIGFSVGSFPVKDESIISVSGDYFYHFAGSSKHSERRPWFARGGLNYTRDETKASIDNFVFFNLRIGRDFNLSKKFGIGLDGGINIFLYQKAIVKDPNAWFTGEWDTPVFPSLGVALFYRI